VTRALAPAGKQAPRCMPTRLSPRTISGRTAGGAHDCRIPRAKQESAGDRSGLSDLVRSRRSDDRPGDARSSHRAQAMGWLLLLRPGVLRLDRLARACECEGSMRQAAKRDRGTASPGAGRTGSHFAGPGCLGEPLGQPARIRACASRRAPAGGLVVGPGRCRPRRRGSRKVLGPSWIVRVETCSDETDRVRAPEGVAGNYQLPSE
jgi:hypothetical protein